MDDWLAASTCYSTRSWPAVNCRTSLLGMKSVHSYYFPSWDASIRVSGTNGPFQRDLFEVIERLCPEHGCFHGSVNNPKIRPLICIRSQISDGLISMTQSTGCPCFKSLFHPSRCFLKENHVREEMLSNTPRTDHLGGLLVFALRGHLGRIQSFIRPAVNMQA